MSFPSWPNKDPNDVLDYGIDWLGTADDQGFLYGLSDTISTSTWIVPTGITKDSDSNTTTATTIWLSGGMAGTSYTLINRIVTVGGRTKDQSIKIKVKEE